MNLCVFQYKKNQQHQIKLDIRKLLNINIGDEEISTRLLLNSNVKGTNL